MSINRAYFRDHGPYYNLINRAYLPGSMFYDLHREKNELVQRICPDYFVVVEKRGGKDMFVVWQRTERETGNPLTAVRVYEVVDSGRHPIEWNPRRVHDELMQTDSLYFGPKEREALTKRLREEFEAENARKLQESKDIAATELKELHQAVKPKAYVPDDLTGSPRRKGSK